MPAWLAACFYSPYLPIILLIGSFGDAFLPTALFIWGEIFFVAGGYAVALHEQYWLILLIWLGAIGGDCISYMIGRHYGMPLLNRLTRKRPKLRLNAQRARRLIQRKGAITLVLARISGPVSKFTPFMAGSLKMPFFPFLIASIIGVLIGTAQFIFAGWALAKGIDLWGR